MKRCFMKELTKIALANSLKKMLSVKTLDNITVTDNTTWHSQNLTPKITVDGQTTITDINFNIANVDVDTVLLEVQGDDPKYTNEGEGFHMVSNTLYWHHFYDLKVGMQVKIRWREE